jgi:hypothetical protein
MSERVNMMNCGDAIRRADNGCFAKGPIAKTAAYTIPANTSGVMYTNLGAIASVTFTLPIPKPGVWLTFIKAVPGQNIVLRSPPTVTVGANAAGASYQNVTAEMGVVTLVGISKTGYAVASQNGTWVGAAKAADPEESDPPAPDLAPEVTPHSASMFHPKRDRK